MKKTTLITLLSGLLSLGCSDDSSNTDTDGGTGGSDGGVTSTLTDEELIKGCLISLACGGLRYPSLTACIKVYKETYVIEHTNPAYDKIYRCAIKANGDCTAVRKCWGLGSACDSTFKAKCEGGVAVSCDSAGLKKSYKVDCAAAGLKCVTGTAASSIAYCSPDKCYPGTGDGCVGNQLQKCQSGFVVLEDCARKGLVCGKLKKGGYTCLGETGVTCNYEFFVPQCKKDHAGKEYAHQCVKGKEHIEYCDKQPLIGTRCYEGDCLSKGKACDQAVNRCSGEDLEVCLDGAWKKYSCSGLGLGPCQTKTVGTTSWGSCGDPDYP